MKRAQIQTLWEWYSNSHKPLILRGARQVGKTTLVRLFAKEKAINLVEVNLELYPQLRSTFQSNNPQKIINALETLIPNCQINPDTLLFLDEIQAIPEAIPALRYFYENDNMPSVIAAGSLLEFVLADHNFSMPVGRIEYCHIGAMTFMEFLEATDNTKLCKFLSGYQLGDDIEQITHHRLLSLLREYFFVGGMPEAVSVYARTQQFRMVSRVHNSIIDTYREDFPKYIGSRNLARMIQIFNYAAQNIGTKVKYSNFSKFDQSITVKRDIDLLIMAKILLKVSHSHCNGLPLQADINSNIYKLLFADIGLMNNLCGLNGTVIDQMDETALINEGQIAEQFIGQHLQHIANETTNRDLIYWLREGKSNNAEVDYVTTINGQIVPIEVKAGASGRLKSLHQFVAQKSLTQALRFDLNPPSNQEINTKIPIKSSSQNIRYNLLSLPLYMVEQLPRLIN